MVGKLDQKIQKRAAALRDNLKRRKEKDKAGKTEEQDKKETNPSDKT
tara:strand:- start:127 stop:267 length:141 start_codon:yes stop_codon:yes gene_type:complete